MVHSGRAVPRHPSAAASRAGTLLAHLERSKEKRKLVGGWGFIVLFFFCSFPSPNSKEGGLAPKESMPGWHLGSTSKTLCFLN